MNEERKQELIKETEKRTERERFLLHIIVTHLSAAVDQLIHVEEELFQLIGNGEDAGIADLLATVSEFLAETDTQVIHLIHAIPGVPTSEELAEMAEELELEEEALFSNLSNGETLH
jgi:hypothetical protein